MELLGVIGWKTVIDFRTYKVNIRILSILTHPSSLLADKRLTRHLGQKREERGCSVAAKKDKSEGNHLTMLK